MDTTTWAFFTGGANLLGGAKRMAAERPWVQTVLGQATAQMIELVLDRGVELPQVAVPVDEPDDHIGAAGE